MLQKYYTSELLRGVLEIKEDLKTNEIAALVQSRIQTCMDGVLK